MYHLYLRCAQQHCDHLVALVLARFPYHETPLSMLHYGTTNKQDEAFIVLEGDGPVATSVCTFLDELAQVIDFAVYPVPFTTIDPASCEERTLAHLYGPVHRHAARHEHRSEGGQRSW